MASVFNNFNRAHGGQPQNLGTKNSNEAVGQPKRVEKTRIGGLEKLLCKLAANPKIFDAQIERVAARADSKEKFLTNALKNNLLNNLSIFDLAMLYVKIKSLFASNNNQLTMQTIPKKAADEIKDIITSLKGEIDSTQTSVLKKIAKRIFTAEHNEWANALKVIDTASDKGGNDINGVKSYIQSQN